MYSYSAGSPGTFGQEAAPAAAAPAPAKGWTEIIGTIPTDTTIYQTRYQNGRAPRVTPEQIERRKAAHAAALAAEKAKQAALVPTPGPKVASLVRNPMVIAAALIAGALLLRR